MMPQPMRAVLQLLALALLVPCQGERRSPVGLRLFSKEPLPISQEDPL